MVVVKYTLSRAHQQIFTSRYQLYLPTADELRAELQHERRRWEQEKTLSETNLSLEEQAGE